MTLRDVLIDELADALGADRQLLNAWPALNEAANAESLKRLCAEGVDDTRERIRRLETVFSLLNIAPRAKASDGVTCLIESALDAAEDRESGPVRDAALLAAIQKLSHYGHASYGSIVGYAEILGEDQIAEILGESLDEKSEAIEEMTDMAEGEINPRAAHADVVFRA